MFFVERETEKLEVKGIGAKWKGTNVMSCSGAKYGGGASTVLFPSPRRTHFPYGSGHFL